MKIHSLQMWDLEHTKEPVYTAKAHASIINQIDGTGGQARPVFVRFCSRPGKGTVLTAAATPVFAERLMHTCMTDEDTAQQESAKTLHT